MIRDLDRNRSARATLVCFHAHPDDESLLTGGTIAKAAADGNRVVVVAATDGDAGLTDGAYRGGLGGRRRRELAVASAVLGVRRVVWLGYADSGMAGAPSGAAGAFAAADPAEAAEIRLRAVVGSGPRWAAARRYLDGHNMNSWVWLPGRVSRADVAGLYRSADLFVAPADLESFGIAALEARCAGLPVLARSGTGVGEFVRHGREGMLAGDDAQMVEQLARLATDGALRESIRRYNLRTPCPITWDAVLRRTDGVYADAALPAGGRPRRPAASRHQADDVPAGLPVAAGS